MLFYMDRTSLKDHYVSFYMLWYSATFINLSNLVRKIWIY